MPLLLLLAVACHSHSHCDCCQLLVDALLFLAFEEMILVICCYGHFVLGKKAAATTDCLLWPTLPLLFAALQWCCHWHCSCHLPFFVVILLLLPVDCYYFFSYCCCSCCCCLPMLLLLPELNVAMIYLFTVPWLFWWCHCCCCCGHCITLSGDCSFRSLPLQLVGYHALVDASAALAVATIVTHNCHRILSLLLLLACFCHQDCHCCWLIVDLFCFSLLLWLLWCFCLCCHLLSICVAGCWQHLITGI